MLWVIYNIHIISTSFSIGFWISSSWLSNSKKYYEALHLPELIIVKQHNKSKNNSSNKKKQHKIRQRRGSESLPPWPNMNADIVCCHGGLSLTKMPRAKRRIIETKYWYFLRKFYPDGKEFKISKYSLQNDCNICCLDNQEAKVVAIIKHEAVILERKQDFLPNSLLSLSLRKSGVPPNYLTSKVIINSITSTSDNNNDDYNNINNFEDDNYTNNNSLKSTPVLVNAILKLNNDYVDNDNYGNGNNYLYSSTTEKNNSLNKIDINSNDDNYDRYDNIGYYDDQNSLSSSSPLLSTSPSLISSSPPLPSMMMYMTNDIIMEYDMKLSKQLQLKEDYELQQQLQQQLQLEHNYLLPQKLYNNYNDDDKILCKQVITPLLPGLYNIIPKKWLQSWRRYIKDITITSLPYLDCTVLLCQSHSLLVIPPHLTEYLLGIKKTLLSGLGLYTGEIIEILTIDEWDELLHVIKDTADVNIRFCIDDHGDITWNVGICNVCNPIQYKSENLGNEKKKSRNSQQISGLFIS